MRAVPIFCVLLFLGGMPLKHKMKDFKSAVLLYKIIGLQHSVSIFIGYAIIMVNYFLKEKFMG